MIEKPKEKGKHYAEWANARRGTSWKDKLRRTIDRVLPTVSSYEEFLAAMRREGYEIQTTRKALSFRLASEGQERFTRAKTLGADYTQEAIQERIGQPVKRPRRRAAPLQKNGRVNLLLDIQSRLQGRGPGYERWLKIHNLKEAAKTLNYLTEHNITDYELLAARVASVSENFDKITASIKQYEHRMEQIAELPPALTPEQAQIEEIAGYLEEAGYAVSSELVEEGLMDYRAHGGKGNSQDVADFIEREFLSEEPEPASLEIAKEFINDFCEAEYGSPADFSDLEKVGIANAEERMKQYPFQLSGGLRQRIMIAMMMSLQPRLLIADEPTTALDVTIQKQVLLLLNRLKQDMKTGILFITHDLGVVAQIADRVIVLYSGSKVEEGATRQIFENPLHPYTNGLIAAVPNVDSDEFEIRPIPGTFPSITEEIVGCRFHPRCPYATERCRQEVPQALEYEPGHFVACHKVEEENK